MQRAFVLDKNKNPLMPCHPARARQLLRNDKAKVFRMYPFTIILTEREDGYTQEIELKIDAGSVTSGMCLIIRGKKRNIVAFAANLFHRGKVVKANLYSRKATRRSRRSRKTRYRKPRFDNRTRPKGWLPPSLLSRVNNILTWVRRLIYYCPISIIHNETVRFDTQLMENAEVSGVQYQQGELAGYEVREYLLEKFGRCCVYCGDTGVKLQIEHIVPKARGGTNRIRNLTLACEPCNLEKSTKTASEFGYPHIQEEAKKPLKDAAAVNATRWRIYEGLKTFGLPVKMWTGGRTKYNRVSQGYNKDHWIDAACVGKTGSSIFIPSDFTPLTIKATGRGSRQMCRVDKYGFPRTSPKSAKVVKSFQTGDTVKAVVTKGKKQGSYLGKVSVRASGSFDIKTKDSKVSGIGWWYFKLVQKVDGYEYAF